jgi:hypothetical protein
VLAGVFGGDVAFQYNWGRQGFPGVTRSYPTFWAAADEQARSRVYGGIHFSFDSAAGQEIGADVGGYVLDNFLQPRNNPSSLKSGHLPGVITYTSTSSDFDSFTVTKKDDSTSDDAILALLN